jgi:hypothetical protein
MLRATLLTACGALALVPVSLADTTSEGPSSEQLSPPDAKVSMKGGVVAAGVGYKWGHGEINYRGQEFAFCIRGLSVGDVGAASLDARGAVYNLKTPEDLAGRYFALSGGFSLGVGGTGTILKSQRGVMMELESLEHGLRFSMAASGVRIVMANTHGCKAQIAR